jgi:hypothetical protein
MGHFEEGEKGMNRDEILAMEPGRELDALVAEKVMGYKLHYPENYDQCTVDKGHIIDCFEPSTDISAAWEVVEKYFYVEVRKVNTKLELGNGGIWCWRACVSKGDGYSSIATSETAPEAICKAALLAVCIEDAIVPTEQSQPKAEAN